MKACFSCEKEIFIEGKPGRRDSCPACGSDLRVCLNCRFHDKSSYNECREPSAERALEKEKANFCDYFEFIDSEVAEKDEMEKEESRKKLDDLFKGL